MNDEPIRFGDGEPYTLGVEEELFLADPGSGALLNTSEDVLERLEKPRRGEVKGEVHACQVELITDVCTDVDDAIGVLRGLRQSVLDTGAGLVASGTHPTAKEGEAEITDSERYVLISDLLGDAVATPVSALHVHVGMPDAEAAIRAFNGLRRHLPVLEAAAANSPFRHGRDTGLASAREITLRGWARSGAPREMASFNDFWTFATRLTKVAGVPDYTFHWWKLRPHPRLGTVEIRALDVQASLAQTAALVAAIHSLSRHEAEAHSAPGPPGEILEEASYRAARGGVEAELPDPTYELRPVRELLEETIDLARPCAREIGCEAELDSLTELVDAGGGAGIQRGAARDGDLSGVLEGLLERAARDAS
jgi:glutamate---cysteine ligase / carboxylate-amine ligase